MNSIVPLKRHMTLFLLFILVALISHSGNVGNIFAGENDRGRSWHEDVRFRDIARPERAEGEVSMSERTQALIESLLTAEQIRKSSDFLSASDAWGSLGPFAPAGPEPPSMPRPEKTMHLEIPDDARGSGTADDPYVDVISAFLEQFQFEPHDIEDYRGRPDKEEISTYMEGLNYEPVTVIVPAGYYQESFETRSSPLTRVSETTAGIDVPPGIRLEAEEPGKAVLRPRIEEGERGSLVQLHPRSALIGFVLDASELAFEVDERHVGAISAHHQAVIAGNHIRHFSNQGITAAGNRGRAGSFVIVHDNIIEWVGGSGISSHSDWLIQDNQIRYAGVLRSTGGGGDDGIIPRWGVGGRIINNLVVLSRRPYGRHVISGQASHDMLFAGNISVAIGSTRNNIGLSDGSHRNVLVGNLALTTGDPTDRAIQAGISVNGYATLISHNVSIGSVRAFRAIGREDETPPVISYNYAEYSKPDHWSSAGDFHRGSHFEAENNEINKLEEFLPEPNFEEFGFFEGSNWSND